MGKSKKAASLYKPEYAEQLIAFFDIEPYEEKELPHYGPKGNITWKDIRRMPRKLPTLRDFAKSIGVPRATIGNWLNKDHKAYQEDFVAAYAEAKDIRKWFLIQNGLQGMYPPATLKFIAVNITDLRNYPAEGQGGDQADENIKITAHLAAKQFKRILESGLGGLDTRSIRGHSDRK